MNLFRRIFFAAVLAGLAAGIVMSGLQQWKVAPTILAAEVYENAEAAAPAATHDHGAVAEAAAPTAAVPAHEHDEDAWAPQDGAERIFYTVLADILKRDERDMARADSPLKPAEDAHLIDTSEMDISAAFDAAKDIIDAVLERDVVPRRAPD